MEFQDTLYGQKVVKKLAKLGLEFEVDYTNHPPTQIPTLLLSLKSEASGSLISCVPITELEGFFIGYDLCRCLEVQPQKRE